MKNRIDLALKCVPPSPFRDQLAKLFFDLVAESEHWRKNGTEDCDGCMDRDHELEDLRRQRDELEKALQRIALNVSGGTCPQVIAGDALAKIKGEL